MKNLERFPNSPAAKRMMKTISPIYDDAYVAKWIFEVMGVEVDQAWEFFIELRDQAFPETATWGIEYWERRYHIPPDESLSLNERRRRVIIKRSKRSPMNPARVEQFIIGVTGRKTEVEERNREYMFDISILPGETEVDYSELIDLIRSIKPSHLGFELLFQTDVGIFIEADSQETYRFNYRLAGTAPDTNTIGVIDRNEILASTDVEGHLFSYEFAGVWGAGEYPQTNTVGGINKGAIAPEIDITGTTFKYNLCGESDQEL